MSPFPSHWQEPILRPSMKIKAIPQLALEPSRVLFSYYQGLITGSDIPTRAAIDPLDIPRPVLPSVYLLEPTADYSDWTYRLVGTEVVSSFRVDRTGQNLRSFLPEETADALIATSNEVAQNRKPVFFELLPENTAMEYHYTETMSLPVEDTRTGKVWLFGGTFFDRNNKK